MEGISDSQGEPVQETQPVEYTELTQQAKYEEEEFRKRHWGYLLPCSGASVVTPRMNFEKSKTIYTIGRNPPQKDVDFALMNGTVSTCPSKGSAPDPF